MASITSNAMPPAIPSLSAIIKVIGLIHMDTLCPTLSVKLIRYEDSSDVGTGIGRTSGIVDSREKAPHGPVVRAMGKAIACECGHHDSRFFLSVSSAASKSFAWVAETEGGFELVRRFCFLASAR